MQIVFMLLCFTLGSGYIASLAVNGATTIKGLYKLKHIKYPKASKTKHVFVSLFIYVTLIFTSQPILASEEKAIHFTTSNSIEPYFFVDKKKRPAI